MARAAQRGVRTPEHIEHLLSEVPLDDPGRSRGAGLHIIFLFGVMNFTSDARPFLLMADSFIALPVTVPILLVFKGTTLSTEMAAGALAIGGTLMWAAVGGLIGFQFDYRRKQK